MSLVHCCVRITVATQSQGRLEPGVDEAAKLPNHFVTDIEKIVQDCFLLCPDDNALPGRYLRRSWR